MASKDVLGKELSSFFKAAVSAFEDVSEQVVQSGRAGKATIDVQVLKRQREKALVRLGELVLTSVEAGGAAPAGGDVVVSEIAALDAQLKQAQLEADKLFVIGVLAAIVAHDLFMVWLCWTGLTQFRYAMAKTEPPQPAASEPGDHAGDRKKPA